MLNPKDFKACFGISSKCQDGKHVIFIDSDNKPYSDFVKDLLNLQNDYGLPDIYILQTENGFNAFCLYRWNIDDCINILSNYKTFCSFHLSIGKRRGYLTLRMSHYKNIISILPSVMIMQNEYKLSLAHYLFFTEIMGYNLLSYENSLFDGLLKFDVIAYLSKKHGVPNITLYNRKLIEENYDIFDYTNR